MPCTVPGTVSLAGQYFCGPIRPAEVLSRLIKSLSILPSLIYLLSLKYRLNFKFFLGINKNIGFDSKTIYKYKCVGKNTLIQDYNLRVKISNILILNIFWLIFLIFILNIEFDSETIYKYNKQVKSLVQEYIASKSQI